MTSNDTKHFDNDLAARFLMAMPAERLRQWNESSRIP
jgi:hypothetical protein